MRSLRTFCQPLSSAFALRPKTATCAKSATVQLLTLCLAAISLCGLAAAQTAGTYQITNLVSDGSVTATTTDAMFINPWGIADGPAFWISAEGTGFNYVVPATGTIAFKVSIPPASGATSSTGTPTGSIYTGSATTGSVLPNGTKASFLFSSLDGIITGWNSKLGTTGSVAQVVINNSALNAVYTGMALLTNAAGTYILAADFGKPTAVEVFDSNFLPAKLTGSFTDPSLPASYAPYSVHVLGTQVFVAYALRTGTSPSTYAPMVAPGNGLVNIFDTSGKFVARAVTGGNLNAPWGVAIAPAGFGIFGGDLLIGNFGEGIINVYDPNTYSFLGQLSDGNGKAIVYASLWDLVFGNTPTGAGTLNTLYFTAGLSNQAHGLFGAIANNATAGGTPTFGLSTSSFSFSVSPGASAQTIVSVAPTNNFTGTVMLACVGLPIAATCSFSPAQISASASAPSVSTLTIQTAKSTSLVRPYIPGGTGAAGITVALLLPFGSFLIFTRRRSSTKTAGLQLLALIGVLFVSAGLAIGCSGGFMPAPAPPNVTPAGTTQVTVTATSGSITQTTAVSLNVQ